MKLWERFAAGMGINLLVLECGFIIIVSGHPEGMLIAWIIGTTVFLFFMFADFS